MKLTLKQLKIAIRESFNLTDISTWESFEPKTSVVDLYHVTDVGNLSDIVMQGLVPGANPMTPDGSPAHAVYFFIDREPARILASKIEGSDGSPVVMHFRIPSKLLKAYNPKIDPEEEFSNNSIAFIPDQRFVKRAIVGVYVNDVADTLMIPKQLRNRMHKLGDF